MPHNCYIVDSKSCTGLDFIECFYFNLINVLSFCQNGISIQMRRGYHSKSAKQAHVLRLLSQVQKFRYRFVNNSTFIQSKGISDGCSKCMSSILGLNADIMSPFRVWGSDPTNTNIWLMMNSALLLALKNSCTLITDWTRGSLLEINHPRNSNSQWATPLRT